MIQPIGDGRQRGAGAAEPVGEVIDHQFVHVQIGQRLPTGCQRPHDVLVGPAAPDHDCRVLVAEAAVAGARVGYVQTAGGATTGHRTRPVAIFQGSA